MMVTVRFIGDRPEKSQYKVCLGAGDNMIRFVVPGPFDDARLYQLYFGGMNVTNGYDYSNIRQIRASVEARRPGGEVVYESDPLLIEVYIRESTGTDPTLSIEGMAADAAATGEKISELSEEKLNEEYSKVVKIVLTDKDIVNDKLIGESGQEINTGAWDCTMPISLPFDDESKISVRCTLNGGGSLAFYTEDGEVLKYISGNNASDYGIVPSPYMQVVDVILPPNAAYIRMSAQKGSELNYKYPSDFWLEGTVTSNVVEEMNRLSEAVDFALDVLDVKEETLAVEYSDVVINNAFINGDGTVAYGTEGYVCTDYIELPAKKGSKATLRSTVIGYCGFAFYDKYTRPLLAINGNNASEYGISPGSNMQTVSITVPDGTRYVRLSASKEWYTAPSDFLRALQLKHLCAPMFRKSLTNRRPSVQKYLILRCWCLAIV